jgi:hypothetical protein
MHVSWHYAIDTEYVHILVKFERRLSIPVQRNKAFFTKKWLHVEGAEFECWVDWDDGHGFYRL